MTHGATPFTYFRRLRTGKNSRSRFPTSVGKIIRRRPAQKADHRDAKKMAAKGGWRKRDFFPVRRRLRKCRFLQTLSVKIRSCIRHRVRTGKQRFWPTFSITDGEKIHAAPPPRPRKNVYFLSYGRGNTFLHTLSVTDGKNIAFADKIVGRSKDVVI